MKTFSKYLVNVQTASSVVHVNLSSFESVIDFINSTLDKGVKIQIIQRY